MCAWTAKRCGLQSTAKASGYLGMRTTDPTTLPCAMMALTASPDPPPRARLRPDAVGGAACPSPRRRHRQPEKEDTMKTLKGITISQLDDSITRPDGRGASAKSGNCAFIVARGRRDYDSLVLSTHRTSRGAIAACNDDGLTVWQWDSYLGARGGFRPL